jgi:hypothetical protein
MEINPIQEHVSTVVFCRWFFYTLEFDKPLGDFSRQKPLAGGKNANEHDQIIYHSTGRGAWTQRQSLAV